MINAHWEDRNFRIQEGEPAEWRRVVDTAKAGPDDILEPEKEPTLQVAEYLVAARSIVVLQRHEMVAQPEH